MLTDIVAPLAASLTCQNHAEALLVGCCVYGKWSRPTVAGELSVNRQGCWCQMANRQGEMPHLYHMLWTSSFNLLFSKPGGNFWGLYRVYNN